MTDTVSILSAREANGDEFAAFCRLVMAAKRDGATVLVQTTDLRLVLGEYVRMGQEIVEADAEIEALEDRLADGPHMDI